jgi:hypothetical protein
MDFVDHLIADLTDEFVIVGPLLGGEITLAYMR